jgi:hypothetical protein
VHNLSIGGCLLAGGGREHEVGDHVEVLLHLPHHNSVGVSAVVRRVDGRSMGLSFEHATPRAEDCIQDLVVEAFAKLHAHQEGHVSLVIEPQEAVRQRLLQQLEGLQQTALGVATALDAVQVLMERGERVDCAFIEVASLQLPSFELVEYLSQHHPHVRRVLIGDATELGHHWLSQASGEVHGLMELPSSDDALQRVLRRVRSVPREGTLS